MTNPQKPKEMPKPSKPEPPVALPPATSAHVSVPKSFFLDPLWGSIKCVVRPATAMTRRKELTVTHLLPRPLFEEMMAPLQVSDTETEANTAPLKRDANTGWLLPTKATRAVRHFDFSIRKGSVADKFFHFDQLDIMPPPPPPLPTAAAQIGEDGVFEVERIVRKKLSKKRCKYLVKWEGYPEDSNTWVSPANIDPNLVRTFEGKPPKQVRQRAPLQFKRGEGCVRARLTIAEQKRGGVPQSISMMCGNVKVQYSESTNPEQVPILKLTFHVLTMDKNGFITWPDSYDVEAQAKLRKQARVLLKRMMEDPSNPVDNTMVLALTQTGGGVRQPPPKRQMVVAPAGTQ